MTGVLPAVRIRIARARVVREAEAAGQRADGEQPEADGQDEEAEGADVTLHGRISVEL